MLGTDSCTQGPFPAVLGEPMGCLGFSLGWLCVKQALIHCTISLVLNLITFRFCFEAIPGGTWGTLWDAGE